MSVNAIKDWQEQKKEISPPPSPEDIDLKKEAIRLACQLTELGSRPKASQSIGLIFMILPHLLKEQITGIKGYFKDLSEDSDDEKIKEECSQYLQYIDEFQRQNQKKKLPPPLKKKATWYEILGGFVGFLLAIVVFNMAAYIVYYNSSLYESFRNCIVLEQSIKTQSCSLEVQKSITHICELVNQRHNQQAQIWTISSSIGYAVGLLYFLIQTGLLQQCTNLFKKMFRNQQRGGRVGGTDTDPNPARTNQDPPQEQFIRRNIMKKKSNDTTQMNGKQMDENKLQ